VQCADLSTTCEMKAARARRDFINAHPDCMTDGIVWQTTIGEVFTARLPFFERTRLGGSLAPPKSGAG